MADYKEIKGQTILEVSSDPPEAIKGDIWYNNTSKALKGRRITPDTWSTGGTIPVSIRNMNVVGTQTATLLYGGSKAPVALGGAPSPPNYSLATASYNGTSWTALNDKNNPTTYSGGGGTSTSAISAGGFSEVPSNGDTAVAETWNGTNWTTTTSLPISIRGYDSTFATSNTSALFTSGDEPTQYVQSWNGSTWTAANNFSNNRKYMAVAGTETAGLLIAGGPGPAGAYQTGNESYNGTNWTTEANKNIAIRAHGSGGTSTSALSMAGNDTQSINNSAGDDVEAWNGTSWTVRSKNLEARTYLSGVGSGSTEGMIAGGDPASASTTDSVEEYSETVGGDSNFTIKDIT